MLSVARSTRASGELELVRSEALAEYQVHARIAGAVARASGDAQLRIDIVGAGGGRERQRLEDGSWQPLKRVGKRLSVNGAGRRSVDFVGTLKAVQFVAEDLTLASGPPPVRRRFMDLLISQLSHRYLVEWQEFNRTLRQRNSLLKAVRERRSRQSELEFWDDRFAASAGRIMANRMEAMRRLDEIARPIHAALSGMAEPLAIGYVPSAPTNGETKAPELAKLALAALRDGARREIAAGHTLRGPHRDDVSLAIGDMEVAAFASRGQARTVVLAMKLAEARLLSDLLADQPIVLLDDVMSELDPNRRRQVMDWISRYEQVILTTAEPELAESLGIEPSARFSVRCGRIGAAA